MLVPVQKWDLQVPPSTQVIIAALNEEEGIGLTIAELNETLIVHGFWLLTAEVLIEPLR